jgi:hypothetical protein
MNKRSSNLRAILAVAGLAGVLVIAVPLARAGGPLAIASNGQPVRWPHREIRGGPLNSATVDADGRILYRVDSGTLGPLSEKQATAFVDRIFGEYSAIPTSTLRFVDAGRIMDPTTNQPVDVNGSNIGRFLSTSNPTFQNPIIFDSDGRITGGGGVLGFFGFLQVDDPSAELREGFVVLNGQPLSRGLLSPTSFLGVFTHEFGHFAGPLDHEQSNGNIASHGLGSVTPSGFTPAQGFDLFAPFTETLFPFIFSAPNGSQLGNQFEDSGPFVATLDMDTQNALSNLYPTPQYLTSRGSIEGQVLVNYNGSSFPITGINVVARRIDQGQFPPGLGVSAYPVAPTLDSDGVPQIPPPQGATDSLSTVASAVTGLELGRGAYRIQGLPPGQYLVGIQQLNPEAIRGSGIGPLANQVTLPFAEEFFNGPGNSSNTITNFVPVTVTAGGVTTAIDFAINGISNVVPSLVDEREPNEKTKKSQKLDIPVEVSASASTADDATLRITITSSVTDFIEDLYKINIDQPRIVFIALDPTSGAGDLDMYLFTSDVSKKKTSLSDPSLVAFSAGPTSSEMIAMRLEPGTYIIGVSAFDGSVNYKLRIFTAQ